jgi:hypothetical protein
MPFFDASIVESPYESAIVEAGHYGIHNFSYGIFDTYFQLDRSSPEWFGERILNLRSPQGLYKTWVFNWLQQKSDAELLRDLQKRGPVYSQQRLPLRGESKFVEVAYDLSTVLNPETYLNHKKRHKALYYPQRWFKANGFKLVTIECCAREEIKQLHDQWVEHKLAQPTTYKLMFPRARYWNCCLKSFKNKRYFNFGCLNSAGELVAVRILYQEGDAVFDLAQFAATWKLPSNFSEAFAMMTMLEMRDLGMKYLNCGASLNKSLSAFKHHWQSFEVQSWAYAKQS